MGRVLPAEEIEQQLARAPATRAAGSPRRARMVLPLPAHWSSRPAPRSRRARNQDWRLMLRHRASSIAGSFVRGPRPLALRTSSWWTKNSLRLGSRRTHPVRKKPGGGPDRSVATSLRSPAARALLAAVRPGGPTPRARQARAGERVALAKDQVRGDIAGCPRREEGRCIGTEFVEQVGQLRPLDRVEERTGHIARVPRPAATSRLPGRAVSGEGDLLRNQEVPRFHHLGRKVAGARAALEGSTEERRLLMRQAVCWMVLSQWGFVTAGRQPQLSAGTPTHSLGLSLGAGGAAMRLMRTVGSRALQVAAGRVHRASRGCPEGCWQTGFAVARRWAGRGGPHKSPGQH